MKALKSSRATLKATQLTYKALVFDLDGTLVDSTDSVVAQLAAIAQEFASVRPSKAAIIEAVHASGGSIPLMVEALIGRENFKRAAQAITDRHPAIMEQFKHLTKPYLGALETLETLKRYGCRLAIFTSRPQWIIDGDPACGIILPYFDTVIALEHTPRPKPHPDGVLAALQALGARQKEALMVGDMVSDIKSAHAAGVHAAALLHGFGSRATLEACQPEYLLDDIPAILGIVGIKEHP